MYPGFFCRLGYNIVCCEGEGKHAFWWAHATPKAAVWMDASDLVVCNKCTKYKENSGTDVRRALISLASAHFCHAEKDVRYFLMVLGALSWIKMLGRVSASERISG